jgi:hypothetical protein
MFRQLSLPGNLKKSRPEMDEEIMTEPTPPKRRRRWFSLSLRGMMLLILVVGFAMGWKARRASLQRRAVAQIEFLHGWVKYDWEPEIYGCFDSRADTFHPPGPRWLRNMLGDEYFQEVVEVELPDPSTFPEIDPTSRDSPPDSTEYQSVRELILQRQESKEALDRDQLACLEGLDRLDTLTLRGNPLKSEGLARLGRLSNLKSLTSFDTPIGAEGLAAITKLSRLKVLYLDSEITDARLNDLKDLPNLEELYLANAWKITDAGIESLVKLSKLKWLQLNAELLTDAGVNRLRELKNLDELILNGSKIKEKIFPDLKASEPQAAR